MSREYQVGNLYVNETGTRQYQVEGVYVNETVAAGDASSSSSSEGITTSSSSEGVTSSSLSSSTAYQSTSSSTAYQSTSSSTAYQSTSSSTTAYQSTSSSTTAYQSTSSSTTAYQSTSSSTTAYQSSSSSTTAYQSSTSSTTAYQSSSSSSSGDVGEVAFVKDVVASDTTTATAIEDITGLSLTVTLNGEAHIAAFMALSSAVSVGGTSGYYAISINGVDSAIIERKHSSASDTGSVGVVFRTASTLPAGQYVVKGRWYTDAGNTLTGTNVTLIGMPLIDVDAHVIPSMFDTIASDTTTATALEDIDNLTGTVTLEGDHFVAAFLTASQTSTGNKKVAQLATNVGGTTSSVSRTIGIGGDIGSVTATDRPDGAFAAGAVTVKGQHAATSGETVTTGPANLLGIGLETGPLEEIRSGHVNVATETTANTVYEDIDGLTFDLTLEEPGNIFASLAMETTSSVANRDISFRITIDGVDQEEFTRTHSSTDKGSVSAYALSTGLAAGTYTVKARWHGESGETMTGTNIQLVAFTGAHQTQGPGSSSSRSSSSTTAYQSTSSTSSSTAFQSTSSSTTAYLSSTSSTTAYQSTSSSTTAYQSTSSSTTAYQSTSSSTTAYQSTSSSTTAYQSSSTSTEYQSTSSSTAYQSTSSSTAYQSTSSSTTGYQSTSSSTTGYQSTSSSTTAYLSSTSSTTAYQSTSSSTTAYQSTSSTTAYQSTSSSTAYQSTSSSTTAYQSTSSSTTGYQSTSSSTTSSSTELASTTSTSESDQSSASSLSTSSSTEAQSSSSSSEAEAARNVVKLYGAFDTVLTFDAVYTGTIRLQGAFDDVLTFRGTWRRD